MQILFSGLELILLNLSRFSSVSFKFLKNLPWNNILRNIRFHRLIFIFKILIYIIVKAWIFTFDIIIRLSNSIIFKLFKCMDTNNLRVNIFLANYFILVPNLFGLDPNCFELKIFVDPQWDFQLG